MNWLLPVFLRIGIGQIIGPFVLKKNSNEQGRLPRFLIAFTVALIIVLAYALVFDTIILGKTLIFIMLVGVANGAAAYCQWRAVNISLSRTYLFTWLDDVIALLLAYTFLHEGAFLNLWMSVGIGCSLIAAVASSWISYREQPPDEPSHASPHGKFRLEIYFWILTYSIIWGVVVFLMRYFALNGIGTGTFLVGWYGGSFLFALLLLSLARANKQTRISFTSKDVSQASTLGVINSTSQALNYWALMAAPLIVVQPIFLISETVFPVLIGLFGFKEHQHLREGEWLSFVFGLLGAILVIVGFLQR